MRVKIVAVGKLKEKYWQEAVREYVKRISPYAKIEIAEVPDEKAPEHLSETQKQQIRDKEGKRLLAYVGERDYFIPLAGEGKGLTSESLAGLLQRLMMEGKTEIAFAIGGSLGLSDEVKQKGEFSLSLSALTFPHQLARVILLEQVYRAFKIIRGETYHK